LRVEASNADLTATSLRVNRIFALAFPALLGIMNLSTVAILAIGIYSAGKVEEKWGKDSSRVVIDEVAGMCLTLLFIPVRWQYVLTGLILFRFFDIVKPLYIRRMEKLKGGWGVMMDDTLAGLYSNLILQALMQQKLL